MRHFYIVTNEDKDPRLEVTKKIRDYIVEKGGACVIQDHKAFDGPGTDAAGIPHGVQCILVLGGDGTMIQAARDVMDLDIPLLGINLGTLGYLAEIEAGEVYQALDSLMEGRYQLEERMMVEGTVRYGDGRVESTVALNDCVLVRDGYLRVMNYEISVNGEHLKTYGADGMIVSTPTGSTGYSLSAGGPIVSPKAKLLLVTPISPHTLNTRSIVLSSEDVIRLRIVPRRNGQEERAIASFDGVVNYPITGEDVVEIANARKVTKIVKLKKESFLLTLSKKLRD